MPDQDVNTNQDQGNGSQGQTGASQSPTDWRESLPPELKAEKTFEKFKGETLIPMPVTLAKSYIEAEKTASRALNAKGVLVPDINAPPEAWDAYYKALGRPDKPEDYALQKPQLPEGMTYDEKKATAFTQAAHKAGLTKKQMEAMHQTWNELSAAEFEAHTQAHQEFLNKATVAMKKEWGPDFESNLAKADAAISRIFGQEFHGFLKTTGLCNHPELIKGMFKASQAIGEHALKSGDGFAAAKPTITWEKLVSMKMDKRYSGDPGQRDPSYIKEVEEANRLYSESLGVS